MKEVQAPDHVYTYMKIVDKKIRNSKAVCTLNSEILAKRGVGREVWDV